VSIGPARSGDGETKTVTRKGPDASCRQTAPPSANATNGANPIHINTLTNFIRATCLASASVA